jgi:hypothetical protein
MEVPLREWIPLLAPWPFIAFFLFNPKQTKALMDWFMGVLLP